MPSGNDVICPALVYLGISSKFLAHNSRSRFYFWKLGLYAMLLVLIVILPLYVGFSVLQNIRFGKLLALLVQFLAYFYGFRETKLFQFNATWSCHWVCSPGACSSFSFGKLATHFPSSAQNMVSHLYWEIYCFIVDSRESWEVLFWE